MKDILHFNGEMIVERTGEWSGNFQVIIKGRGQDQPVKLYNFNGKDVKATIEEAD
jgi:hypothetical protein